MTNRWLDPSRSWWAKVSHAGQHIERIRELERDYLSQAPWSLDPEPTGREHTTNYRLSLHEAPPTALALYAGDALHNLASALDAIAFGLALDRYGDQLDGEADLQRVTEFPVRFAWSEIQTWGQQRSRGSLYGPRELLALWRAQTYYWSATAWTDHRIGPEPGSDAEAEARYWDKLARLRHLNNIDKHRRLHLALLGPDLIYWSSERDSERRLRTGGVWKDGEVVAQVFDPPSTAGDSEIQWDLRVVFAEGDRREIVADELQLLRDTVAGCLNEVARTMSEDSAGTLRM